jgi:hypothetical protein
MGACDYWGHHGVEESRERSLCREIQRQPLDAIREDASGGEASTASNCQKSVSANQYKPSSCTASSGVEFP